MHDIIPSGNFCTEYRIICLQNFTQKFAEFSSIFAPKFSLVANPNTVSQMFKILSVDLTKYVKFSFILNQVKSSQSTHYKVVCPIHICTPLPPSSCSLVTSRDYTYSLSGTDIVTRGIQKYWLHSDDSFTKTIVDLTSINRAAKFVPSL